MCRVLVVDDDDAARRAVERLVAAVGHDPITANGVETALDVLDATCIDVVLTDLRLGHADGLMLASAVRARWPWIPVLLMSGDLDDEVERLAADAGVARCLAKPFARPMLEHAVAAALGS